MATNLVCEDGGGLGKWGDDEASKLEHHQAQPATDPYPACASHR